MHRSKKRLLLSSGTDQERVAMGNKHRCYGNDLYMDPQLWKQDG